LAVRVEDAAARRRLRLCWYAEEISSLFTRALLLLVIQALLHLLVAVAGARVSPLEVPTGETPSKVLTSAGLGLGLLYAWPVILLVLLRVLRWPQLLRLTGIAVLAATTGRGLAVWMAHLLAIQTTGAGLAASKLWILADPVDWAFLIAGAVVCLRAWRLAGDARQILPQDVQTVSRPRKVWSCGLLAATGVYAVGLLGFVGIARYQASAYLLQPGIDPQREHEALLALREGATQANKGDLGSAERSLQRSLRLWEDLTKRCPAPPTYRVNLATTLYDLGWISERQSRNDEAEKYYTRAVALGDELAGNPQLNEEFKRIMADARQALADSRNGKSRKLLAEKEQTADRKYEEAQVKADTGDHTAEALYRDAIALWEEILSQATNEAYRSWAVTRLAGAYLQLGEFQQRLGKSSQAESSLRKAIDYGEKAVGLERDRPLASHNLEVARRMLEGLRERALQEEITKLCAAQRFADAIDLYSRTIEDQEKQVRSGKDHEVAVRRLAYRLDRFGWFLAHCPDGRVRDTRAAGKHARRATELQPDVADYWFTLAMVQYRNGDWRESLISLEKVKAKEGSFDASDWLLMAMDRHQLRQKDEARAAFRKAIECIDEQQRKAEDNALLRFQFEMARPGIEALRREAENLIEGKDFANQGVG
jgi:tetratricopeptide (TPR) repeat protein